MAPCLLIVSPSPPWTNPVCWPYSIYYSPCSGPFQMPLAALSLIIYNKNFPFNHTLEQFPLVYTSDTKTLKHHLGSGSMESSLRLKSQSGCLSGFCECSCVQKHVGARGTSGSFRHHLLCLGQLASEPGTTCLHVNCWEYKPKPSCLVSLFICVICVCDCGSACYDIHMEVRGQILELIIPFHCVLGTKLSYQI